MLTSFGGIPNSDGSSLTVVVHSLSSLVGRNVLSLFPSAAPRLGAAPGKPGDGYKDMERYGVGF